MSKRLLALILSLLMIVGSLQGVVALSDKDEKDGGNAAKLVVGLGLMSLYEDGTFKPEENITRAQFADIISTILNYKSTKTEGKWDFFGESSQELLAPNSTEDTTVFFDVNPNHWAYNSILFVKMMGLMNGFPERKFEPETGIKYNEAVKVMVQLLGYTEKAVLYGGYPAGYLVMASELSLTSGIALGERFTRGDLAKMLGTALGIPVLTVKKVGSRGTEYETSKNKTFLSEFLGIEKSRGTVKQNSVTSFVGRSTLGSNKIQVENTVISITKNTKYLERYIGRNIDCYYKSDDNNDYEAVYGTLTSNNDAVTFPIKDFENISGQILTYNEDGRNKSANILFGAAMIHNGLAVTTYNNNSFDYDDGTVTLISTDDSSVYDLIIVEGYENWFIKSLDTMDSVVFNKLYDNSSSTDDVSIKLDTAGDSKNVTILNEKGESINFLDLEVGMSLDVSRNGEVIFAIASKSVVENFVLKEKRVDENIISDGLAAYSLSEDYKSAALALGITIGDKYKLHLNSFGKVIWMDKDAGDSWRIAYVKKFKVGGLGLKKSLQAQILVNEKTFKSYDFADRFILNDNRGVSKSYKESEVAAAESVLISFNESVIRYKLDDDEKIKELELPLDMGLNIENPDRLYTLLATNDGTEIANYTGDALVEYKKYHKANFSYSSNQSTFGARAFINDADSKVLNLPIDREKEDKYAFISRSNIEFDEYVVKCYGTNSNSKLAKYVVLEITASTNLSDQTRPMLVTKISNVLDSDGNIIRKISGYQMEKEVEVYDDVVGGQFDKAVDRANKKGTYTISEGDIIRYSTDSGGKLTFVEMMFDADGTYEELGYGLGYQQKGILAGSIGYYTETMYNTNPLTYTKNGLIPLDTTTTPPKRTEENYANRYDNGVPRYFLGYVYDFQDNYVTYTSQNIGESLYDPTDARFITETRDTDFMLATLELSSRGVTARKGSPSDIRTYKSFGKNLSRIFVVTAMGDRRFMVIINGEID